MTATLAAVLGLTLAQPPAAAPDYYPLTGRTITLPIEYKGDRKGIGQVQLYASADKGQTWPLVATVLPDKTEFSYTAQKDGSYWFHIVIVDRAGKKDPPNLTTEAPAMKVLVDTVRPVVEFRGSRRTGEEVVVEWDVRDDHLNDAATKVTFRRADGPADDWREVTLPPGPRNGVRFPCGTTGPVQVRVTVADLAGNTGEGLRDIGAVGAPAPQTSVSLSGGPPAVIPPAPALTPAAVVLEPLAPAAPLAPTAPAPLPAAPAIIATPPVVNAAPPAINPTPTGAVPTFDPRTAVAPLAHGNPAPAAGPAFEASRAQVVKSLQFDLSYQVDQRGPSGISRVDLWATRDDGRSWVWWSKHAGNDPTVRVNLGIPSNTQPEGPYGFRLVPVSGAGLSDATPAPGDAPDVRVVVDITAPTVTIFPPSSDPADPTALVLQWEAADRNFGDDPITLEWSDSPTGPWRPVVGSEGPVVQVGAVGPTTARRVANTGRYAWRVPAGLPPRVYLKVTARDAAGNATEQVTREPLLIDLTKPRARITGVGAVLGPR
ncbi:hypothetical protein [Urbifossiella limnaea]|uniref:Ser-Thr-rich glycosyl-phosphatidyl-inositol-anchored membrane family protein n=1 Tax=Urbifossiella limnaea TaxID=2528023 RepID=A0A517XUL0_9BACT|nr:hypothetical protein [Urbifossiella limnaea]QDU21192.1 hypothetical protein ETAA1_31570 [Urbifossiella limnaea]